MFNCGPAFYSPENAIIDPFWRYVTLYLTGQDFVDRSDWNHPLTSVGVVPPTPTTAQAIYGTKSLDFTANSISQTIEYVAAVLAVLNFDYTIEAWYFPTGTLPAGSNGEIISSYNTTAGRGVELGIGGPGNVVGYQRGTPNGSSPDVGNSASTPAQISQLAWGHLAACRNGNVFQTYANGVGGSAPVTYTGKIHTAPEVVIGREAESSWPAKGYIAHLRVTVGKCRYTANFTPPAAAFPRQGPGFAGRMDSLPSAGLFACGGLERLLVSYTGPLVRVHNLSTGTHADIGYAGTYCRIDEQALYAFGGGSFHQAVNIEKVYDQSGNGNDFVPSFAEPTLSGTYGPNWAMGFGGTQDLTCINNSASGTAKSIFLVCDQSTYPSPNLAFEYGTGFDGSNTAEAIQAYPVSATQLAKYMGANANYTQVDHNAFMSGAVGFTFNKLASPANTGMKMYLNGALVPVSTTGAGGAGNQTTPWPAAKWRLGRRGDGFGAPIAIRSFAIYENDQSANGPAITSAFIG